MRPFRRPHFDVRFHKWKVLWFDSIFTESGICSGNDLSPNRRQSITRTNGHLVHRRIYAALGADESLQSLVSCDRHYYCICMWYPDHSFAVRFSNMPYLRQSLSLNAIIKFHQIWDIYSKHFISALRNIQKYFEKKNQITFEQVCTCHWTESSLVPVMNWHQTITWTILLLIQPFGNNFSVIWI